MITKIQGVFFDGQSSKPNLVEIYLHENAISFEIDAAENIVKEIEIKDIENIDFSSTGNLQLKFGEFPFQTLMVEGDEDIAAFKSNYPTAFSPSIYTQVLQGNVFKVVATSFAVMVGVVIFYLFVAAPFIADWVKK